jgi:hypothetical protein
MMAFPLLDAASGRGPIALAFQAALAMHPIRDLSSVRRLPAGVLDVGQALLSPAFDLLDLAFGFLAPVAGQLAETFLDLTFGLVGSSFGAQIGHFGAPASWHFKSSMNSHAVLRA